MSSAVVPGRPARRSAWTPPAKSLLPMILKKLAMAMPIRLKKCGLSGFMEGSWYLPPRRPGDRLQHSAAAAPELAAASRRVSGKLKEGQSTAGHFFWLAHGSHGRRDTQRRAGGGYACGAGQRPSGTFAALQYKRFWRIRVEGWRGQGGGGRGARRGSPRHGPCEFQPPPGFRPAFSRRKKSHQECSTALEQGAVDPHVRGDAGGVAECDDRCPFEMAEKGVLAACLPHQGHPRGRTDGQQ